MPMSVAYAMKLGKQKLLPVSSQSMNVATGETGKR